MAGRSGPRSRSGRRLCGPSRQRGSFTPRGTGRCPLSSPPSHQVRRHFPLLDAIRFEASCTYSVTGDGKAEMWFWVAGSSPPSGGRRHPRTRSVRPHIPKPLCNSFLHEDSIPLVCSNSIMLTSLRKLAQPQDGQRLSFSPPRHRGSGSGSPPSDAGSQQAIREWFEESTAPSSRQGTPQKAAPTHS